MGYREHVLADAPLAYYRLGETSGTALVDATANGRNGTYTGTYTLARASLLASDANPSVDFANGYAQVGYGDWMQPAQFSVEVWCNADSVTGIRELVARHGSGKPTWELSLRDGKFHFYFYIGAAWDDLVSVASPVAGTTYHIVATFDGSTRRLYVNGQLDSSKASAAHIGTTCALSIGNVESNYATNHWFDGRLDEVAFYGTALSSTRVKAHYDGGVTRTYPGTVLLDSPRIYWRLDEASGNAIDSSGNAKHGTWKGTGTPTRGVSGLVGDNNTAVSLPTANARVEADDSPGTITRITVEAWVKPGAPTGSHRVIAQVGAYGANFTARLRLESGTNRPQFSVSSNGSTAWTATSTTAVTEGTTYHLVGTYDGTTVRLYVNGTEAATLTNSLASLFTPTAFGVGAALTGPDYMNGTMDEVAYYLFTLSATRVKAHYDAATPPAPVTPAVSVWDGAQEISAKVSVWDGAAETSATVEIAP